MSKKDHIIPLLLIFISAAVYAATLAWLYSKFGVMSRGFGLSFVCVAAYFWGLRGGVLVAVLALPFNLILYRVYGLEFSGGLLGIVMSVSIAAVIGRIRDLSVRLKEELQERKRADEELSKYKIHLEELVQNRTAELSRLATAIDQAAETIVITDTAGVIQYVNPAFEKVTGYSKEEAIGKNPKILQGGQKEDSFYKTLWTEITEGRVWSGKFTNKKKDGSLFQEEATISPVRDPNGDIINFVAVKKDITREFELENMLRQTQKMEAIGTLAGGIAHDFNNILSAIIGYTEIALMQIKTGTKGHENLQKVLQAGERAKYLVQQILTFSRQDEKELGPVQIDLVVKEVIYLIRATLPATIEIKHNINSDIQVMGDVTQIHQILMNLCTNAGYAMQGSGGMLTIDAKTVELSSDYISRHPNLKPGPYVELAVSDTGPGIPGGILDKIFEPFFTTKEKGKGTGMGLAVAHGIVKSIGGDIYAFSEEGSGATFNIILPAIERRQDPERRNDRKIPTGTEHILLIDDEPTLTEIGKKLLASLGYTVTTKTDSTEALNYFENRSSSFDLVITDVTMPGLTGDELAKRMMAIRPDIPIILYTGFSTNFTEESLKTMGIRALVMKPILKHQIADTIRNVLDKEEAV